MRGRNPLERVSDGNFNGFRSFQAILCHFGAKNGYKGLQNNTICFRSDLDVLKVTSETISIRFLLVLHFEVSQDQFATILCSGPKMALSGPKMTQNGLKWPQPIEIAT